ncbi:FAD binding domain of DNA photolyase-domain-containing protein [Powellomyces hirtus]|nr:FAD binding domain of DNA photolyase-domain-containing protein [Powellomyces hirtus]
MLPPPQHPHACTAPISTPAPRPNVLLWIRAKTLRLHDSPALHHALSLHPSHLHIVFCFDPFYTTHVRVGTTRWQFLLSAARDFDSALRKLGNRLIVPRGKPGKVLPVLWDRWGVTHLVYERDEEPYPKQRDGEVEEMAREKGIVCAGVVGHTIWDPREVAKVNGGRPPLTYAAFLNLVEKKLPRPGPPIPPPVGPLPPHGDLAVLECEPCDVWSEGKNMFKHWRGPDGSCSVPALTELGLPEAPPPLHRGGETEALRRLSAYLSSTTLVAAFEKPKTSPTQFSPSASTTVLSPYLKFGCLSARLFRDRLLATYAKHTGRHTHPPVSLLGQLYWREFFYAVAAHTPNFDRMEGNPLCLQVPWRLRDRTDADVDALRDFEAWRTARTGYPWIDAIMTQLRTEGWIHHLARHAVACFLTRGHLYISWERGAEVFEQLLIDHDWSLNTANWLWLSASAFYTQYVRVYSPVAFPKKYDPSGEYVRKYVPVLRDLPAEWIYEPWKAPLSVQRRARCVVGVDYPERICEMEEARKRNIERMRVAYKEGVRGSTTSSIPTTPVRAIQHDDVPAMVHVDAHTLTSSSNAPPLSAVDVPAASSVSAEKTSSPADAPRRTAGAKRTIDSFFAPIKKPKHGR